MNGIGDNGKKEKSVAPRRNISCNEPWKQENGDIQRPYGLFVFPGTNNKCQRTVSV